MSERIPSYYLNYGEGTCVLTTLSSMLSAAHHKCFYLGSTPAYWFYIKQQSFVPKAIEKAANPDNIKGPELARLTSIVQRANTSLICAFVKQLSDLNKNTKRLIDSCDFKYPRLYSFDELRSWADANYQTAILTYRLLPNFPSHVFHVHFSQNQAYDVSTQSAPRLLTPEEVKHHEIAMNEIAEITGSFNAILIRPKADLH